MLAEMVAAYKRLDEARRIVLCPPDMEARAKAAVDSFAWAGLIDVQASEHVPEGVAYVISQRAVHGDVVFDTIRLDLGDTP
jgi:hypothetical protein